MNMNILDFEKKCSGCAACVDSCPFDAISISQDIDGFYTPTVNSEKCVNCQKCVNVCPALDTEVPETKREFFYGWNNDEEIRKISSSGGLFTVFANKVLSEGGVVFGAIYSEDFKRVIITSTENAPLSSMRTSKYVQSNAAGAYRQMESFLNIGRKVLFCAAPCQIAGARKFFGNKYENLILVDFLCGGFPSPSFYSQYITWIENKMRSQITHINFRDKKKGWSKSGIKISFKNGKEYFATPFYDPYYYYYCTHLIRNSSCLGCKFRESRYTDITIADFWGFKKLNTPNDEKGMSLIITYNDKGKCFFDSVKDVLTLHQINEEDGSYGFESNEKNEEELLLREEFLNRVREKGFIEIAKQEYFKNGKFGIVCRKITGRIKSLFVK